jgi:multimeric flavodoxin WrbA
MMEPIRIVGLNGSPHREGNTATLMRWVLEGCEEAGAEVEWLHVVDYDVRYCQGCMACLRRGICTVQDDVPAIRARLLAAAGVVAGSPVYAGQPSAQLKALLDRLALLNLFTRTFEHLHSVGVATSGAAPTGGVAADLADFFGRRSGAIGAKVTTVAAGYTSLARVHDRGLPPRARALGRRLVRDIVTPRRFAVSNPKVLWIGLLWRFFLHPLVTRNPEQFGGVIGIWKEKGWLKPAA